MADNEPLRYGIIGAQNWGIGGEHVRTVLAQEGVDLVAVCNRDEEQRNLLRDAVPQDTPIIADAQELLDRGDLDAVVICTPNQTHVELAGQAFAAGLHVLCEKPLGRTVAECDEIIAARDRAGRQLLVGMHRRYNRLYERLRRLIDAGELGRPTMMWTQEFRGDWKKLAPHRENWRYSQELSGGSLMEKNVHDFDTFNWFADAPAKRVMAMGGIAAYEGRDTLDHALVIVEYDNGFKADLQLSLFTPHGFPGRYSGIVGTAGSVRLQEGANEMKQYFRDRPDEVCFSVRGKAQGHGHGMQGQHEAFARCIREGKAPLASGEAARAAVAVAAAAEQSVQTGQPVQAQG